MVAHVPLPARPLVLLVAAMTAGCGDADASCFAPDAVLPKRAAVVADPALGQSARALAEALFDRDLDAAGRLLAADPALAKVRIGERHAMLTVALATCEPRAVELLLARGAPTDPTGDGGTLQLAMMANDPAMPLALLRAGADPTPAGAPLAVFRTATALGSRGGIRLLLDHKADPNVRDRVGGSPLQTALDMERFAIAELLIDRGADPWAIDVTGGNLATAVTGRVVTSNAEDDAARRRLAAALPRMGWPAPPPAPAEVRRLALDGAWPPAGVKARPVPPALLSLMAQNARTGTQH
jgi:uncharacterized protein